METKQKLFRQFTLGFITFVATVLLSCFAVLMIVNSTLFSSSFVLKMADKSNFFEHVHQEIVLSIQDLGRGSGIPPEVIKTPISQEQVTKEMTAYIHHALDNRPFNPDKAAFTTPLSQTITDYALAKKNDLSTEEKKNIERFVNTAYEQYQAELTIPFLPALGQKMRIFKQNVTLFSLVSISGVIILMAILFFLQHRIPHRIIRYSAILFSSTGLILLVFPTIILFSGLIKRLSIAQKSLYQLVVLLFEQSLWTFIMVGGGLVLVSIIFAVIATRLRQNKINATSRKKRRAQYDNY
ncbi:hypothetical protein CBF34_05145 [Vagococcus penaei]|uniref:Uncharacterized protein n=1 Tax=Vagococcus penaei TaxID=633807 RepID=A0A1Q2D669_9ENTE|nr:hypothetical protein [Vagococcus penaei]AQP53928.1 hypothetical protein BW732_06640 [Vagococcus penaei]RSU02908.1 hypothetical protein CBF34_05145 [Vagococcus penaei]